MPIAINGTGTITGLSAGGLPDDCITTAEIAGSAVTTAKLAQPLTLATAQASTSGTAIDFTGIPSWVKRVTVIFNGVSTNGTTPYLVQIGSGSFTTSGYVSTSNETNQASSTGGTSSTSGFVIKGGSAAEIMSGTIGIFNVSGNIWISSHTVKINTTNACFGAGDCTISGSLDRVRITSTTPDTFDAGSVNIMYEG